MTVTYWTGFSKRKNSTKLPGTTGTDATCALKDDTSIMFPDIDSASIPANANYMYIADFGRYYFVRDVTKVGAGRNVFHLEEDTLGTYKSQIGSTSAFVMYATGGSGNLIDSRIPMKAGLTGATVTGSFPWTIDPTNGRYLLTVMSKTGVKTYNMNYVTLVALLSDLDNWTDDIFNNIPTPGSDLWDAFNYGTQVLWAVGKQIMSFNDASGCLVNCVWIPISYSSGVSDRVYLGNYDTGHDADFMNNEVISQTVTLAIPWVYNDWRNNSPYCQMYLYIPFVGNIQIDPSLCIGQTNMYLKFGFSRCTGDCSVQVKAGSGITIGTYSVNIAAKYPVGAMQADPIRQATSALGAVGGAIGAGAGIISGNPAAIVAGAGAIVGSTGNFMPTPTTIGGMGGGSGSGLDTDIRLNLLYHDTIETPGASNATIGKPVMSTHTIGSYSGYVQCSSASIDITGYPDEKDTVNSYVNSGFYYE